MQKSKKGGIFFAHFNSPIELHSYITSEMAKNGSDYAGWRRYSDELNPSSGGGEEGWNNGISMEKSLEYLKFGNKETVADYIEGLNDYKNNHVLKDGFFMDQQGFAYDMGAVINGEPDCCINQRPEEPAKVIDILVGVGLPGSISERRIMYRGLGIFNLLTSLLQDNYVLNLKFVSTFDSSYSDGRQFSTIDVPLDYSPVSTIASMTSVDFFRNLDIILGSIVTEEPGNFGDGRSLRREYWEPHYESENPYFFINDWYDDSTMGQFDSTEEATEYIKKEFIEWAKENLND